MTTEKQTKANRKNAKKAGVKTKKGKEKSMLNALKHGLSSKILIDDFEQQLYDSYYDQLSDRYSFAGPLTIAPIERLAFYSAKLHKVKLLEKKYEADKSALRSANEMLKLEYLGDKYGRDERFEAMKDLENEYIGLIAIDDLEGLDKVRRYAKDIENGYYKAQDSLMKVVKFELEMDSFCVSENKKSG